MSDRRALSILIAITIVSIGLVLYSNYSLRKTVNIPVSAEAALNAVKGESSADAFIKANFGSMEDRIERVALAWDQKTGIYMWEIEIQERSCGCKLNETEGVTILRASVDPYTGVIYNLSTRIGVPEETIKREACEKGCHVE